MSPTMSLSPWTSFDRAWTAVMGYPADQFSFVVGKTAFSTFEAMAGAVLAYLVVIFGGQEFMRDRKPLRLDGLFKLHNLALTILSAGLLVLFMEQLIPTIWKYGLYENICGAHGWTAPLVTLYYLNYIVKYIELADTVFLMMRKKPLTFLHCYHHPATAFLCYSQLIGRTSVSWVPITLNLMVHVVMYWYYFQSARGVKIWWKEWITRLQITQFVIDLFVVYFASWDYWTSTYYPSLPHVGTCAGHPAAAVAGCVILSSYLVLFVLFYISTYKIQRARQDQRKSSEKKGSKSTSKSVVEELAKPVKPALDEMIESK